MFLTLQFPTREVKRAPTLVYLPLWCTYNQKIHKAESRVVWLGGCFSSFIIILYSIESHLSGSLNTLSVRSSVRLYACTSICPYNTRVAQLAERQYILIPPLTVIIWDRDWGRKSGRCGAFSCRCDGLVSLSSQKLRKRFIIELIQPHLKMLLLPDDPPFHYIHYVKECVMSITGHLVYMKA